MPSSAEILLQLSRAANGAVPVAIAWHAIVLVVLGALGVGWRPSERRARALLAAPLLSVGLVALAFGNPFNAAVFLTVAVALVALGRARPSRVVRRSSPWATAAGAVMIATGFAYPHFLEGRPLQAYVYAAPLGVLPCPTLYAVIGFALLGGGLGARRWAMTLGAVGLFYGVTGVASLGVTLDVGLVVGALVLALSALRGVPRKNCARPDARARRVA